MLRLNVIQFFFGEFLKTIENLLDFLQAEATQLGSISTNSWVIPCSELANYEAVLQGHLKLLNLKSSCERLRKGSQSADSSTMHMPKSSGLNIEEKFLIA
jgi:hypothetical protein